MRVAHWQQCLLIGLFVVICIIAVLQSVVSSRYSSSSSWTLINANRISKGEYSTLDDIIVYYESRGTIAPPVDGYGTSRFSLGDINISEDGLALLRFSINMAHNFNPDISAWAAVSAMRVIPNNALPVVLLCKSLTWNPGFSLARRQCIQIAKSLSSRRGAGELEVLYSNVEICHLQALHDNGDELSCVRQSYTALLTAFPDDVDARAFFAWYLVDKSIDRFGAPKQPLRAEAQAMLTTLRAHYPWHHGLAHYVIHAWEDTLLPVEALSAASTVLSLCPRSPHLVHMIGHVHYLLGDYHKASAYFSASHSLEVCPLDSYSAEAMSVFIDQRGPHLPNHTCEASSRPIWCHPYCNSSLHNWEMHHNIAFEIMTLSQAGQMSAVREWAELGLAMRPWADAVGERVPFPLVYSPQASRAMARYYYQDLLSAIDAYLSAGMWSRAIDHAERVIRHVQGQQSAMSEKVSLRRSTGDRAGQKLKRYVLAAAESFALIPLGVYAAKSAYASLMNTVFTDQATTSDAGGDSRNRTAGGIRETIDVDKTMQYFATMKTHASFLNDSIVALKKGDVSYSVIERNIRALLVSLKEAEGLVAFVQKRFGESIAQLISARDMSPQNVTHSVIPYNEPVVIPRPIAETLGAIYEYTVIVHVLHWYQAHHTQRSENTKLFWKVLYTRKGHGLYWQSDRYMKVCLTVETPP